jgi:hypothetical protein
VTYPGQAEKLAQAESSVLVAPLSHPQAYGDIVGANPSEAAWNVEKELLERLKAWEQPTSCQEMKE